MRIRKCFFPVFTLVIGMALFLPHEAEAKRRNPRRARGCNCAIQAQAQGMVQIGPRTQFSNMYKNGSPDMRVYQSIVQKVHAAAGKGGSIPQKIGVNSGYRDCNRNCRVGGASRSPHLTGRALDLTSIPGAQVGFARSLGAAAGVRTFYATCRGAHVHADLLGTSFAGDECKGSKRRSKQRRR